MSYIAVMPVVSLAGITNGYPGGHMGFFLKKHLSPRIKLKINSLNTENTEFLFCVIFIV